MNGLALLRNIAILLAMFSCFTYAQEGGDALQLRIVRHYLETGEFRKARIEISRFVLHFPLSPLIQDAELLLAQSYHKEERYIEAITHYNLVLLNNRVGPQAGTALIAMTECLAAYESKIGEGKREVLAYVVANAKPRREFRPAILLRQVIDPVIALAPFAVRAHVQRADAVQGFSQAIPSYAIAVPEPSLDFVPQSWQMATQIEAFSLKGLAKLVAKASPKQSPLGPSPLLAWRPVPQHSSLAQHTRRLDTTYVLAAKPPVLAPRDVLQRETNPSATVLIAQPIAMVRPPRMPPLLQPSLAVVVPPFAKGFQVEQSVLALPAPLFEPDESSVFPEAEIEGTSRDFVSQDKKRRGREWMKAAQILILEAKTIDEMEQELRRLVRAGIDTVIVRVFHNAGDRPHRMFAPARHPAGVYFSTKHAAVQGDLLDPLLTVAHDLGLRVFAWMTTKYAEYGGAWQKDYPSVVYDLGSRRMQPSNGLNLFSPKVQEYLSSLYDDLCRYPIDGILFQDDHVLRFNEGFNDEALAAFQEEEGFEPKPERFYKRIGKNAEGKLVVTSYGEDFTRWATWKNRHLLRVAGNLIKRCRAHNPDMHAALNFMYEAVTSPRNALAWFSQDIAATERTLGISFYSIMAYHLQMERELQLSKQQSEFLLRSLAQKAVQVVGAAHKVLIKLQVRDWESSAPVPDFEFATMLGAVQSAGATPSIAIVPYTSGVSDGILQAISGYRR